MTYALTWLPGVLKAAGLKVATVDGWETRGHGDMGTVLGVICHHTAGGRHGNMPSLGVIKTGRTDLAGPLAQLGLGRDGTYYVVAAGRCWHAGAGTWNGLTNGNTNFIGIEAENTGGADDFPWPDVQLDAYRRGVAAILTHLGLDAGACCAHREYALPAGRKPDPPFEMTAFRAAVAGFMTGTLVAPLIPAVEPTGARRPTLRRGATGEPVKAVQRALRLDDDGMFGAATEAAVRAFQRDHHLVPEGIVGPKSWGVLDTL